LSYLQPNSVFYSAMMPGVSLCSILFSNNPAPNLTCPWCSWQETKRKTFAGLIGLNVAGFLIYLLGSYSFWLPASFSGTGRGTKDSRQTGPILAFAFLLLSGIAQFFVNFTLHPGSINTYNSVDNFYLPAACGSQRQLKPGLLLRASAGNSYVYMWVSKLRSQRPRITVV
jgi:drug/metabolite transporter (DMT)-like permease